MKIGKALEIPKTWRPLSKNWNLFIQRETCINENFMYEHPYAQTDMEAMSLFLEAKDFDSVEQLVHLEYEIQNAFLLWVLYETIHGKREQKVTLELFEQLIKRKLLIENDYAYIFIYAFAVLKFDTLIR